MRLSCVSCSLRLNELHFCVKNRCYAICDICRARDLDSNEYYSYENEIYAQIKDYKFIGSKNFGQNSKISLDSKLSSSISSLIHNFDQASHVVKSSITRKLFYQRIIDLEDKNLILDDVGNFFDNLEQLGFAVGNLHNLQKIDSFSRMYIYQKYHNVCQYCGRKGYSVDHMIPVSSGGSNDLNNLTLSCQECNKIKGDMPYEWFVEFNLKINNLNHQLVIFEQQIDNLKKLLDDNSRVLNAYVHRTGQVVDPHTEQYRVRLKKIQDLYDGFKSDYNSLRTLRKKYFITHRRIYEMDK